MKIRRNMRVFILCMVVVCVYSTGRMHTAIAQDVPAQEDNASTVRDALLSAARNAIKQSNVSGAAFYYTRYLEQQPDNVDVALEFAGVLSLAGRFKESLAVCDKVLNKDPANPEAQKLKAIALGQLGRTDEALRLVEELRLRFPDNLEFQKIEAGFRAMRGDREFSREFYSELLRAGLNNPQDWQDYLQLLAADRQWDLLIDSFERYRDRFAVNDHIRFSVIQARMARNEIAEAEKFYKAMTSEDLRRDAALTIADQLAAVGKLDAAIEFLEPLLNTEEPDPDLTIKIALLEAYSRRPAEALQRLDNLSGVEDNSRLEITRAKIYWAAGRPGDALARLDLMSYPDEQVEFALTRAGLLYDLHREWEVIPTLARVSTELERSGEAERRLAWCLTALADIRLGEWESARDVLGVFKKSEPGDLAPDILMVLLEKAARRTLAYEAAVARLGVRLRDYRPGIELIRPALLDRIPASAWEIASNMRPSNPFSLIEYADAVMRECQVRKAADLYETAVNMPEIRVDALIGVAQCAWRMNDVELLKQTARTLQSVGMDFDQLVAVSRLMIKAGMDGMAEAFISRIGSEDTNLPDARVVRAAWLVRGGRLSEARELLAEPEPTGPVQIGVLVFQCGRMAELARNPDDPVYTMARDRIVVLADCGDAAGLADGSLAAADVLLQHGEYDRAREILVHLEQTHPYDLRINDRLMTIYIRMGLYEEAETQARKVLARRPGDATRRGILARICVWESDYALAWRRYRELLADYPDDRLFPLEMSAKRSRALGRMRRAADLYSEYAAMVPTDREMVVEAGDVLMSEDFTKAATERYREASWAFVNDKELKVTLDSAERQSHWGTYARADHQMRKGHDGKVDVREDRIEGGVRFPRGPDAMTLDVGLGRARFQFDDDNAEELDASLLAMRGRWFFQNGMDLAAGAEAMDYKSIDSTWRANVDVGYRGIDGWKVAAIAGRQDVRDNYYTILDGLQSSWVGAYGQWQPIERLELFGQYRLFAIDAPSQDALLPSNVFATNTADVATTQTGSSTVTTNASTTDPRTWEENTAQEGVIEASYRLLFFPHSLRLWVNGYFYETGKDNDMYWTPEDAFLAGQVGLHWRHTPGSRHYPGAPLFFYGAYAAAGKNSEGDYSPTLKLEIGLQNWNGWGLSAEAERVWGDKYEENSAHAGIEYLF